MEALYIDLCNKIAGYHNKDCLLYHHLGDIPNRIDNVGVELTATGYVVLTKPGMRLYLDKRGDELQVWRVKGTFVDGGKYETDISDRQGTDVKYAYQEFIMSGMKFSAFHIPLYLDGDRMQASYAHEQFGRHIIRWPRSFAPTNEHLGKMKRLYELVGPGQTSHVEVQMRYSETGATLSVVFLGVCGMPGFMIHFSEKENRLVFTYYQSSPEVSQECKDFFMEIAAALNLPPT